MVICSYLLFWRTTSYAIILLGDYFNNLFSVIYKIDRFVQKDIVRIREYPHNWHYVRFSNLSILTKTYLSFYVFRK